MKIPMIAPKIAKPIAIASTIASPMPQKKGESFLSQSLLESFLKMWSDQINKHWLESQIREQMSGPVIS